MPIPPSPIFRSRRYGPTRSGAGSDASSVSQDGASELVGVWSSAEDPLLTGELSLDGPRLETLARPDDAVPAKSLGHECQRANVSITGGRGVVASAGSMRRVHLFVHGRGQGHATRSLAVGRALADAGCEVDVSAGPDALAVLRGTFDVRPVDSLPPAMSTAAVGLLAKRVAGDRARLRARRPDVVVSDGDLPGAAAARSLGVPVVAIGHGLTFLVCRAPMAVDRAAWYREAAKAWVASAPAAKRVAVNFVPLVLRRDDAILARPTLRLPERRDPVPGKIVCYFRDAPVREAFAALVALGKTPVSYGRTDPEIEGIEHRARDRERFMEDLSDAEGVVASAGSQLISECVALGLPFFGLYGRGDDEQALNVAMLRAAGLGDGDVADGFERARLERTLEGRPRAPDWPAPSVAEAVLEACRDLADGPSSPR
jgi:uncharacterized protein (TIGR00661 family)